MVSRLVTSGDNRFRGGLIIGLLGGIVAWLLTDRWQVGLLSVVILAALVNVLWALLTLWPMDAANTGKHAGNADVGDEVSDLTLVLILIGSLTAIGVLLLSAQEQQKEAYAALALLAILSTWAMLHTMYTARYARVYYQGTPGGIDFNDEQLPRYVDFYYFSFNLGMTYQVSDTAVTESDVRKHVLKHCLLSYIYGTVVIACTINLVINLVG
ncbi:DUF1345 domain-containing protein [Millisia brevis]|uniref:DUF1345 domain-containing protein n=1 Tax=Millisia brevis TaxID=264148 RepID=UPI0008379C0E|nr:DUF1345 domain-containing protein [Millisia brevis]